MVIVMKENGKMINLMDKEFFKKFQEKIIQAILLQEKNLVKESKFGLMVIFMKENGKMIYLMVKAFFNINLEIDIKDNLKIVKKMVKVLFNG